MLYPTIFGLNDSMRSFAAALAAAGSTAVVWDPYDGVDGSHEPAEMVARSKQCEDRAAVRDLEAIADHMQGELGLTAIGGLGWCFGGRVGLLHAAGDDRIGAFAAYNPTMWSTTPAMVDGRELSRADFPEQTMDEFELVSSVRGPVQICRPEHDFTRPEEYERLFQVLARRGDPTILEYFPGAEHAFSFKPGPENERAQRLAWAATLALFDAGLEGC
ncbi:MAG: dienelactone hydrolase family protein [Actinobacteria bacterium]|nr:dienelactone hydrolase family protein [Actinomycetota bacterium]